MYKMQFAAMLCTAFAVLNLAGSGVATSAEKPVHIFVLSGQSNMAGMDPKIGFADEAEKLFPDADVRYFKVARGGQPIRLWVAEWDDIAKKHGLAAKNAPTKYYQPILEQYRKLLSANPNPASVTFCWMQGERDAKEGLSSAYHAALSQLIENLRRDLKQPRLHFVIGRLSDFGKETDTHWQSVRRAQVRLAEEDAHGSWVDCDDLNNKMKNGVTRNDLHYTKEGYALLGRRFVRQAKALIEGKQPAADGRPE